MSRRTPRPRVALPRGERVLAWASLPGGAVLAGTRDALYLPAAPAVASGQSPPAVEPAPPVEPGETLRLAWEEVEAAEWDADAGMLRVSEVGTWGEPRREHTFTLQEPRRLLQLLRERVSASVVLQRHVAVSDRRGLRVIARRAPRGDGEVQWFFEYDQGVDPGDPMVLRAAAEALASARADVETS